MHTHVGILNVEELILLSLGLYILKENLRTEKFFCLFVFLK